MTLIAAAPTLRTPDLPGSIRFYTEALGFRCKRLDRNWGWATLERDESCVMLSSAGILQAAWPPALPVSVFFAVDDVAAFWSELKDKAVVCYPLFELATGTCEFAIYDNNGDILQFVQASEQG